jgi:hypothetical protein
MCALCRLIGVDESNEKQEDEKRDGRFPWEDDPINIALPSWEGTKDKVEEWMMENGLGHFYIDEIALMFSHQAWAQAFALDAVRGDQVEIFNSATDRVQVQPFNTHYEVEYIFLDVASDMRIEVMSINHGFSPLHAAIQTHLDHPGRPCVVHMSFKVPGVAEYAEVLDVLHESTGQMVQECKSDYGMFSYWHLVGHPVYLKPRVNLRDEEGEETFDEVMKDEVNLPDVEIDEEFGMPGLGNNIVPFPTEEEK